MKSHKAESQAHYRLKEQSKVLTSGRAIGQKIGAGVVKVIKDASQMARVQVGNVEIPQEAFIAALSTDDNAVAKARGKS